MQPFMNFTFIQGLGMLFVDIWIYAAIGYYCDQVAPRDVGLTRSIFFPCQGRKSSSAEGQKTIETEERHN